MKIYVASSWRNKKQPQIVKLLRKQGYGVYDFRNPTHNNNGFHWSEIDPEWKSWDPKSFRDKLTHPVARNGFECDFDAMKEADVCVMVMPCGRSAHLEAGYFVGSGKSLYILLSDGEPELMYNMADHVCIDEEELIKAIKNDYE